MVKPSKGPLLRQAFISLTIVVISFCAGLIEAEGQEQLLKISENEESDDTFKELVDWRNLCQNTMPFVGVILLTAITEFGGRKPAAAVIILLTITASSLSISETKLCLKLVYIAICISSGGQVFFYVCTAEYCEPKYRLMYSILTITFNRTGYVIKKLIYLYLSEVFPMYYVRCFELFLATMCFVSLFMWPESPYWLASKGKQEQSKKSFLMLRRDETACEKEFKATLELQNHLYSSKLYFIPISITVTLFSTFWCGILFQNKQLTLWWIPDYSIEYQGVMECLIIFVLVKTIRFYYTYGQIVVILLIFISVTFQYAFAILFYTFFSEGMMSDEIFIHIVMSVLFCLCYMLVIIGPTTLSISKFAVHIPIKRRSFFIYILSTCFFLIKIFIRYLATIIEENFGNFVLLLVLTTQMALGMVFSCFFMPKTKGKTLIEIENVYLSKR